MLEQITPLILTRNESPNIRRTLEKLAWAREIVVVDSFSDDGTPEIVAEFPQARIFQRAFDSHAQQWNFGLRETGIVSSWIMALDADYVLADELVEEIDALQPANDVNGYRAPVVYCVGSRRLRSAIYPAPTFLYRRQQAEYYSDGHTQRIRLSGRVATLHNPIYHDDRKPLARWFDSQARYQELEARKLRNTRSSELGLADRLRKLRLVAPAAVFLHCLIIRGGIFEGPPGMFYALQRFVAESMLSLFLIEHDIKNVFQRSSETKTQVEEPADDPPDRTTDGKPELSSSF